MKEQVQDAMFSEVSPQAPLFYYCLKFRHTRPRSYLNVVQCARKTSFR